MSRINPSITAQDHYELVSIECLRAIDPRTGNQVIIRGPFFTMRQLGAIFGMSERSVYAWSTTGTLNGRLRTVIISDSRLASASMVYEFLKNSGDRIRSKLPIFEDYMRKYQEANMLENTRMSAIEAYTPKGYAPRKVKVIAKRKREVAYERRR